MTIDIYPAYVRGRDVIHADDWDEDSTMNLANANAFGLIKDLNLIHLVPSFPSTVQLRTVEMALTMNGAETNKYAPRLKKLCAIARIKKASHISFA